MPAAAQTQISSTQRSTYGDIGLLDMPSARMAPDGELGITASALNTSQRYNLSFQFLPWLEGSFRYSHISDYSGPNLPLYDRSLGVKVRLSREDAFWPELSVGVRDILGTGVYGAEYAVATKKFGPLDVTLGTGWGRLADNAALPNPLGKIFSSFQTRGGGTATGGTVNFGQIFHGPDIGIFGGVQYHTPVPTLDVMLEYSSDHYLAERTAGFKYRSPLNIGLTYRPFSGVQTTAGWYYGSSYGFTISFTADPTTSAMPQRLGPPVPDAVVRGDADQQNALTALLQNRQPSSYLSLRRATAAAPGSFDLQTALVTVGYVRDYELSGRTLMINSSNYAAASGRCGIYAQAAALRDDIDTVAITNLDQNAGQVQMCRVTRAATTIAANAAARTQFAYPVLLARLKKDMAAQNIELVAFAQGTSEITLYYSNNNYAGEDAASGRIARLLMADLPPDVEIFHLVPLRYNMPMAEIRIVRSTLERAITAYATSAEIGDGVQYVPAPAANPALTTALRGQGSKFNWGLSPGARAVFFDPDVPLQGQIYARASINWQLSSHLSFNVLFDGNLINNFDTGQISNSLLPHVRTDASSYFKDAASGLRGLDLTYTSRLGTDIYGEFRAGILEEMFAGVGGQILWRPGNGRWAYGLDGYEVRQRDFYGFLGLQNYQTFTGHVSVYYQSPWSGLNFAVHAGQYLAKDYGATFEVSRRFQSGVEIGAFATFTNVPFAKFGEGSFDKGIYIRIPFEWALPVYTRSDYAINLRSITRDGGARLSGDDSLYRRLIDNSGAELGSHIDELLQPER